MEFRGELSVEEGAMMTTTESTNIPLRGVGKGAGDCDGDGDGDSDSGSNAISTNAAGGNGMEGRAYRGGGGNDVNDGIDKRPIQAAMVMARATLTVAAAAGRW